MPQHCLLCICVSLKLFHTHVFIAIVKQGKHGLLPTSLVVVWTHAYNLAYLNLHFNVATNHNMAAPVVMDIVKVFIL